MKKSKSDTSDESSEEFKPAAGSLSILVFFLLLVTGIYFYVANKSKGGVVFPAGLNYLSPNKNANVPNPTPLYDFTKLMESKDWLTYKGKFYPYSFQYPKELKPLTFPNDQSDSVTFTASSIPPELNLMFLVETISSRDKKLTGKPKEFVQNYWKFFSGLKDVKNVTEFTNKKGLKGYKANYVAKNGVITNDNYFFMIPDDDDHMLHIADIFPEEGRALFKRIVDTLDYKQ